jgi:hypothetical protein
MIGIVRLITVTRLLARTVQRVLLVYRITRVTVRLVCTVEIARSITACLHLV